MRYEEELEAYFAGALEGAMGARSWLGPWVERQSPQGSQSSGTPPEPGLSAIQAARDSARVRGSLRLLTPLECAILRAHYTPRGPHALRCAALKEHIGVACVLEGEDVVRSLIATKAGRTAPASKPDPKPPTPDERRAAGRELRRLASAAKLAVEGAAAAYIDARERWVLEQHRDRTRRFLAFIEGR